MNRCLDSGKNEGVYGRVLGCMENRKWTGTDPARGLEMVRPKWSPMGKFAALPVVAVSAAFGGRNQPVAEAACALAIALTLCFSLSLALSSVKESQWSSTIVLHRYGPG